MCIDVLNSHSETGFEKDWDSPAFLLYMDRPHCTPSPELQTTSSQPIFRFFSWFPPSNVGCRSWVLAQCSVLLAPSSANPKATQCSARGRRKVVGEFTAHPPQRKGDFSLALVIKDIMGFSIRKQVRKGTSFSPFVRRCSMVRCVLLFQVDNCLCFCECCYIIWF